MAHSIKSSTLSLAVSERGRPDAVIVTRNKRARKKSGCGRGGRATAPNWIALRHTHTPPAVERKSILSAFGQGTPPNSLHDVWRTSGESNNFCPPVTAPVRLWPPELAKAKLALGGPKRFCPPLASARSCGARLLASPRQAHLATSIGYRLRWRPRRKSCAIKMLWIGTLATWPLFEKSGQVGSRAQLRPLNASVRARKKERLREGQPLQVDCTALPTHTRHRPLARINARTDRKATRESFFPRTSVIFEMRRKSFCQVRCRRRARKRSGCGRGTRATARKLTAVS